VLVGAQLAARGEHPRDLGQRRCRIGHAAQQPHADDGVEGPICGRQPLGGAVDHLDRDRRRPSALGGGRPRGRVGLDREHRPHAARIELERTPLAAADLDHPAAQAGVQAAPQLPRDGVRPPLLPPLEKTGEP